MTAPSVAAGLDAFLDAHLEELITFRRELHAHPELSGEEHETTARVAERLRVAGLAPRVLPCGTGLLCDLPAATGSGASVGPTVALRADLDALAMADETTVPYRSQVPGVAHACGHDVHTTVVLGAGLALDPPARGGRRTRRDGAPPLRAGRGVRAGWRARRHRRGRARRRRVALRPALRPQARCRPDRGPGRCDHVRGGSGRDPVARARRPHRAASPDGGPRRARRADRGRPPGRVAHRRPVAQPRVRRAPLGRRRERDPRDRAVARHVADS